MSDRYDCPRSRKFPEGCEHWIEFGDNLIHEGRDGEKGKCHFDLYHQVFVPDRSGQSGWPDNQYSTTKCNRLGNNWYLDEYSPTDDVEKTINDIKIYDILAKRFSSKTIDLYFVKIILKLISHFAEQKAKFEINNNIKPKSILLDWESNRYNLKEI